MPRMSNNIGMHMVPYMEMLPYFFGTSERKRSRDEILIEPDFIKRKKTKIVKTTKVCRNDNKGNAFYRENIRRVSDKIFPFKKMKVAV